MIVRDSFIPKAEAVRAHAIEVERCTDAALLSALIRHPAVYPGVIDDASPPAEQFALPEALVVQDVFLLPRVNGVAAGWAWFHPESVALASYHGALLPEFRGGVGVEIGRAVFQHFWEHTLFDKVMALCPMTNKPAQRFNAAMGMRREGTLTRAYRQGGSLVDLVVFGIERKEV